MATTLLAAPVARPPAGIEGNGPILSIAAGAHCNDADIVKLSTGAIIPCVANDTTVAGIIQHDSGAVFHSTDSDDFQNVFGADQTATPLVPATPQECLVATLGPPIVVEMNLTALTGWITGGTYQANLGTAVGLAIDGTTGFFLADPNASNKVADISGKPVGPNKGVSGDLAARVLVTFRAAALNPAQGM